MLWVATDEVAGANFVDRVEVTKGKGSTLEQLHGSLLVHLNLHHHHHLVLVW
jgi:hypothetical protein